MIKSETRPESENDKDLGINLVFFDLKKFMREVSEQAVEGDVNLGEYRESRFWLSRGPLNRLNDSITCFKGSLPLYQPHEFPMAHLFNPKGKIGHVYVKGGHTDISTDEDRAFEEVGVKFYKPIELKSGLTIPEGGVRIYRECGNCFDMDTSREDWEHFQGFGWRKADLSKVLPTELFLRGSYAGSVD